MSFRRNEELFDTVKKGDETQKTFWKLGQVSL